MEFEATTDPGGESAAAGYDELGGQEQGPPPWLDSVNENFTRQLGQFQQELSSDLDRRLGPRQEPDEGYEEYDGYDDGFEEGFEDPAAEEWQRDLVEQLGGDQPDDGLDRQQFENEINRHVAQQLEPLVEARRDEGFAALMEEFPSLQSEEGAAPVVALVRELAHQFGSPDLARNPVFARLCYCAQMGEERAAAEQEAGGGSEAVLEQGGGSPPEPVEDDVFQQLHRERNSQKLEWPDR